MTYDEFIQNILNTRGRFGIPAGIVKARHHIVPRCKGGQDCEDNLIDLYPQEHYDAHQLLFEENPTDYQLAWAWACFHMYDGIEIDREKYAELYLNWVKLQSERMTGEGNPHYDVHTNYNSSGFTGKRHTKETKQLMSKNSLWKNLGTSNRRGATISETQKTALNDGFNNIDNWHEINLKVRETRRKNGTSSTKARSIINITTGEVFKSVNSACKVYNSFDIRSSLKRNTVDRNGNKWEFVNGEANK